MIKRRRGRPKKLEPIRGEDVVAKGNLVNCTSSVFDDFDNAASDAVNHQDVVGGLVLGCLDDTIVDDVDMHGQVLRCSVNSEVRQKDRPQQTEQTACNQDYEYNHLELTRAKAVR